MADLGLRIPRDVLDRLNPRRIWSGYVVVFGYHKGQSPNMRVGPDAIYAVIHSDNKGKVTEETEKTFNKWIAEDTSQNNEFTKDWFILPTTLCPDFDQNYIYSILGYRGITNDLDLLSFVEARREDKRENIPLNTNLFYVDKCIAYYCPVSFYPS